MVSRAHYCIRMMPILRLTLKQGYIRNDATTRAALNFPRDAEGSKKFGTRLCDYARQGLIIPVTGGGKGKARVYRLTNRGHLALDTNGKHAQRSTVSARLDVFWKANPDEELTFHDIALKFNCTVLQARRAADYLTRMGVVERVRIVRAVRVPQRRAA
jgi:hypothetical protein